MIRLLPLLSLLLLVGCGTFQQMANSRAERKRFEVKTNWVVPTIGEAKLSFRKINRFSPILFNDLVIQGNSFNGIYAFNKTNGDSVWRFSVTNGIESAGSLSGGKLYFSALDGNIYCLEASTGKMLWSFNTKVENLSEPLVLDGKVFVLSGNNTMFAINQETGIQTWLYSRQESNTLSIRGGSKPAFKDNTLFVGFSDGSLVALNALNGAVKWEKQLNKNKRFKDMDFNPIVLGERIFTSAYDDKLYSLDLNGNILWKFDAGGYGGLTIFEDKLFFSSTDGELYALYVDNGQKIWSVKSTKGIPTEAKIARGLVVYGESAGSLRFLDAQTGKSVGSFEPGRGIFASPTVTDKMVYFISNEGSLYAMDFGWNYRSSIPWIK